MGHPLEDVIRNAEGFILIGDSSADRFPAYSYYAYTHARKRFYCLDLGGLPESRGKAAGGKVYHSVEELPDDHDDLAIIWVHPNRAAEAVDIAHEAGCTRVWFSFGSGHRDAVARARELDMDVIEIGRCPVYYLDDKPIECKMHTAMVKVTGAYRRPPQLDSDAKRREVW
jgi:predicted CoA-binding protein